MDRGNVRRRARERGRGAPTRAGTLGSTSRANGTSIRHSIRHARRKDGSDPYSWLPRLDEKFGVIVVAFLLGEKAVHFEVHRVIKDLSPM
jgi:hypothetical protein